MRFRGPIAVFAMARPGRPARERVLVRQAAARLAQELASEEKASASALARVVAERALDRCLAEFDLPPDDPMAVARRLQALLPCGDPIAMLAHDDVIDIAAAVVTARRAKFEARRYRRLPAAEQQREDCAIRDSVLVTLVGRWRKYLKPLAETAVSASE